MQPDLKFHMSSQNYIMRTSQSTLLLLKTLFLVIMAAGTLVSCKDDDDKEDKAVVNITSFSPESGVAGDEITITGENFEALKPNTVKFNGATATMLVQNETTLIVEVPAEATTGKITVTTNGKTVTSSDDFTILAPTITDVSKWIGSPGLHVLITGTNFSTIAENNVVKFNGTSATVDNATNSQLDVIVPAGATTGRIEVMVGTQSTETENDFQICNNNTELVVSNVTFTDIKANEFTFTFDITNVGSADLDLAQMALQNYVSADAVYGGNDQAAGGTVLSAGGILSQGETYTGGWTSSQSPTTYPYLIMQIYNSGTTVNECNTTNNQQIIKIE